MNGADGAPWIVDGVFEELDQAGEWYFNATTRRLYYWHNATATGEEEVAPPPADLQLVAGNLTTLIRIVGTTEVRATDIDCASYIYSSHYYHVFIY